MTPSPSPKFVYCVAVSSVVGVIGAAVLLYNESITGNITHMYNMKRHRRPHSSKDRIADPHTLFNHTPLRRHTKSLVGSYGFLDIDDSAWDLKRAIHARQSAKQRGRHYPSGWEYFTNSWEPTTSCDFEERIGSQGDGGRWVDLAHGLSRVRARQDHPRRLARHLGAKRAGDGIGHGQGSHSVASSSDQHSSA